MEFKKIRLFSGFIAGLLAAGAVPAHALVETTTTVKISDWQTLPALVSLPADYATSGKSYPLLVFLHGAGEYGRGGSDFAKIYNSHSAGGPAYFIEHGQWPASFTNPVDGKAYQFIVVSPQAPGWSTNATQLDYVLVDVISRYRVDASRVYLTGLSAGGQGVTEYVSRYGVSPRTPIAAFVPMSAAIVQTQAHAMGQTAADDGVFTWGFGSDPADTHGISTHFFVNGVQSVASALGRFTNYSGGHCCWGNFYAPTYTENVGGRTMNVYQWMLTHQRGGVAVSANAGPDQALDLPTNVATLNGSSSIGATAYAWSELSGPNSAVVTFANSSVAEASGLVEGTYVFRLSVNGGASQDTVSIVVRGANHAPIANAGPAQTITPPANSVTLSGAASKDSDGSIVKYAWKKTSGGTAVIASPSSMTTAVTGLVAGTYVFRLVVTDNEGATGSATVSVQVSASQSTPKTVNVNLYGGSSPYGNAAWNDWNVAGSLASSSLRYADGSSSSISARLTAQNGLGDNWTNYVVTMCPQAVARFASYNAGPDRQLILSGLNDGKTYALRIFASRANTGNSTTYKVGGQTATVITDYNKSSVASFSGLRPASGVISVNLHRNSTYDYLNGFTLTEQ